MEYYIIDPLRYFSEAVVTKRSFFVVLEVNVQYKVGINNKI